MFKFSGGDRVKEGQYWNFSTGERMRFKEEGILPGDSKDIYIRARSGFLLLVIAPFLGLAYAFFFRQWALPCWQSLLSKRFRICAGRVWSVSPTRNL